MFGMKVKTSIGLSREAIKIAKAKAKKLGVTMASAFEIAIRKLEA